MILLELFWEFFKVGLFCFGGAFGMIPLIGETVLAHGWLTESQFYEFIGVCESTPGPIAVNLATFVGAQMGGIPGALCATLGIVLPSFVVILLVARCYTAFRKSKWIQGIMSGLKPAVVGLIGSALVTVALAVFVPGEAANWLWAAVVAVMFFVGIKKPKLHPIVIICICGAVGILAGYLGL